MMMIVTRNTKACCKKNTKGCIKDYSFAYSKEEIKKTEKGSINHKIICSVRNKNYNTEKELCTTQVCSWGER